jgi:hypothetical protein
MIFITTAVLIFIEHRRIVSYTVHGKPVKSSKHLFIGATRVKILGGAIAPYQNLK